MYFFLPLYIICFIHHIMVWWAESLNVALLNHIHFYTASSRLAVFFECVVNFPLNLSPFSFVSVVPVSCKKNYKLAETITIALL